MSRSFSSALLLVALLAVACAPAGQARIDLAERFAEAEVFTETALIDVGDRPARRFLGEGWLAGDERWAGRSDESFVWAAGDAATFRFFVFEPRDLVMVVRARPNPHPDALPLVQLGIAVNDQVLGRPEVTPGWGSYRVVVPRQVVSVGENRVRLIFGDGAGAEPLDRRLAVERIEFERTLVSYPPRREVGEPALLLPYLSGVWYEVDARPGDRLRAAEVVPFGPHGEEPHGRLEIVTAGPDGTTHHTVDSGAPLALTLPEGTTRIGIIAVPAGDPNRRVERPQNEEAVGLLLRRPAIRGGTAGST